MVHPMYVFLKELIATVPEVKSIEWFNVKYITDVVSGNVVFIQFLPIDVLQAVKEGRGIKATARVHVVTKTEALYNGAIPDCCLEEHDALCDLLIDRIEDIQYMDRDKNGRYLSLASYQPQPTENGNLITFIDFSFKI